MGAHGSCLQSGNTQLLGIPLYFSHVLAALSLGVPVFLIFFPTIITLVTILLTLIQEVIFLVPAESLRGLDLSFGVHQRLSCSNIPFLRQWMTRGPVGIGNIYGTKLIIFNSIC